MNTLETENEEFSDLGTVSTDDQPNRRITKGAVNTNNIVKIFWVFVFIILF